MTPVSQKKPLETKIEPHFYEHMFIFCHILPLRLVGNLLHIHTLPRWRVEGFTIYGNPTIYLLGNNQYTK